MSISSDSECPAPVCPSLPQQINADIREEELEGQAIPSATEGRSDGGVDKKKEQGRSNAHPGHGDAPQGHIDALQGLGEAAGALGDAPQGHSDAPPGGSLSQKASEAGGAALLNYDSVKYTLVVDEDHQLELVSLKNCWHGYNEHNDDSDAETVYQSANEEEDPDYQEERKRRGGGMRRENP